MIRPETLMMMMMMVMLMMMMMMVMMMMMMMMMMMVMRTRNHEHSPLLLPRSGFSVFFSKKSSFRRPWHRCPKNERDPRPLQPLGLSYHRVKLEAQKESFPN